MSSVPRIRRTVVDSSEVFEPERPIPVVAGLRWYEGRGWGEPRPIDALVVAWSLVSRAVRIEWRFNGETRSDWIDADAVTRRDMPTESTPAVSSAIG